MTPHEVIKDIEKNYKEEFETFCELINNGGDTQGKEYWLSLQKHHYNSLLLSVKEMVEQNKKHYRENGNYSANPMKWESSIGIYNTALSDLQSLLDTEIEK